MFVALQFPCQSVTRTRLPDSVASLDGGDPPGEKSAAAKPHGWAAVFFCLFPYLFLLGYVFLLRIPSVTRIVAVPRNRVLALLAVGLVCGFGIGRSTAIDAVLIILELIM